VGGFFGGHIANAHALGQAGETLGHVLGDRLGGFTGFQSVRIGEEFRRTSRFFGSASSSRLNANTTAGLPVKLV